MRTFVLGDIHGAHRALVQCLERSSFHLTNDQLIFLGDVCDRWPETIECIDTLLTVKHLIPLMGNHDQWLIDWANGNMKNTEVWLKHGGETTLSTYKNHPNESRVRDQLFRYKEKLLPYHKDSENRVFVHAGFNWRKPIEETDLSQDYSWDRSLFNKITSEYESPLLIPPSNPYKEIYIGHSPTHRLSEPSDYGLPLKIGNVWCMDQGAGWGKRLSMMDIDTKEVFQSDCVDELY